MSQSFKKLVGAAALILCTSWLTGCATAANPWSMTVDHNHLPGYEVETALKNSMNVGPVEGGETTNPLGASNIAGEDFKVALNQSLKNFGFLDESGASRYQIDVSIKEIDRPMFGLDLKVKIVVLYVITNKETKEKVFEQTISAEQTATFSDAALAIDRLKIANERAGKESILQFLKRLKEVGLKPGTLAKVS